MVAPVPIRLLGYGAVLALAAGCATFEEGARRDTLTSEVGVYPPPPAGLTRARVGVPPMRVTSAWGQEANLDGLASDQATTLLHQSARFSVVERTQLQKLLDEQNLEGIVRAGELARPGQVRGVDYLLLGKVDNLRVKREKGGGGLSGIPVIGGGFEKGTVKITTECGVDLRLVDPTTGEICAAHFGEFLRTDSADLLGISILGIGYEADADIQISEDDKGKILRLALDDALRKMLPQIDQALLARAPAPAAPGAAPAAGAAPAEPGPKFCSACGGGLEAGAKFCAKCGAAVQR
jgi:curli biogenesis system outer membrane secretion channel CsgG